MPMRYSKLTRTAADARLDEAQRHGDFFEGGPRFRERVAQYLLQNQQEPSSVFALRCRRAHYLNYIARMVRWFSAATFLSRPAFTASPSAPAWYAQFQGDVDGLGTDFETMLGRALTDALVYGRAYLRVVSPEATAAPSTLAQADRLGLTEMRLAHVPVEQVTHWRRNPDGSFAWVLERQCESFLRDLGDDAETIVETFTEWRADGTARRWRVEYAKGKRPRAEDEIPEAPPPTNRCGEIPLVEMVLPPELHLVRLVFEPQLEHFRKRNALSWAVDRNCFSMPFFYLKDPRKPPTMGVGYYGMLGLDEKVEWPAPPSAPFEVIASMTRDLVQEMHRVVEQMALAVDNNSSAAVGRSGESKAADQAASSVVLSKFGAAVRELAQRVLSLVSAARGDMIEWTVDGLNDYRGVGAPDVVEMALSADPLRVPSVTHRREVLKRVSRAMLPDVSEETRQTIEREIDAGINAEDTRDTTIPPPGGDGAGAPDSTIPPEGGEGDDTTIPRAPRVPREMTT